LRLAEEGEHTVKDTLAEKLLAKLLEWGPEDVAEERPILQALAAYKYDEYQEFSAGSRFMENLTLWLNQFETPAERRIAYEFVTKEMAFCSTAEMRHLVEIAYPDFIRPLLLARTAQELHMDPFQVAKVAARPEFAIRQRQCLFLGLSDGSRIDTFRRANPELNHEQIWQTYELSKPRVEKLLKKLAEHLAQLLGKKPKVADCKFRTLVLLDDFSASGRSYCVEGEQGKMEGKVASFFADLCDPRNLASRLVDLKRAEAVILLYMATHQALDHLRKCSHALWGAKNIPWSVEAVQPLGADFKLVAGDGHAMSPLIEKYYDHDVFDRHLQKGGTQDARYGFAACGLPLVLHHNTPNNSIALLWSYEDKKIRGLFPRVRRHKEMT
jgi:hypothetical protein